MIHEHHAPGNEPIHQDGDEYVNHVRFYEDGNTTNEDGEGNSCHHSNPEVKKAGKVAEVAHGAPGHMHGMRHGTGSKPHHAPHSLKHSKGHK